MLTKFFSALALVLATTIPAGATPTQLEVIAYDEMMVLVPNLEFLGYSRISTVEHCAEIENINDWTNLITDEELYGMEACLIEHT
jgi:hypothetical protein